MTTYIPYSTRKNITDPDLAGLLDYLERDMGWDINHKVSTFKTEYFPRYNDYAYIAIWSETIRIYGDMGKPICEVSKELFFRTYRTLLPAIRDLYSK